jgi:hypothetical protein
MISTLNNELRLFTLQDRVSDAVDYLDTEELSAAIVVENGLFLGVMSMDLLIGLEPDKQLNTYAYLLKPDCILNDLHWFHSFELFSNLNTDVLAVVDQNQNYCGAYRYDELNKGILSLSLIKQAGYIIVLSLEEHACNFGSIVDLIERNGGKLLGILITDQVENRVELTVKIAIQNCDMVVDALSRAAYQVMYSDASDHLKETLKDHAAYFNAYLNL